VKVNILETGKLPETLEKKYGNYTSMFSDLLKQLVVVTEIKTYEVTRRPIPTNSKEADLWLITGSSCGVYDDLAWIPNLKGFIKQIVLQQVPLLGVCFGHQILAEAMGGRVEKSPKGWGVGVHEYKRLCSTSFSERLGNFFSGYASHQDQVVIAPKKSITVYGSQFCPHSILAYGEKNKFHAISLQSHPEFSAALLSDLIRRRIGTTIPTSVGEKGLLSLDEQPDNLKVFKSLLEALSLL
tara:strand:- start:771 stop:1490 length:720 start_codon:yes stop_codon:yes gene_type:complete